MSLIVSDTTPISCLLRIGRPDLLPAARPIIDQVRTLGGLWVTDELVAQVLTGLGE
jgi:predicted nucleic acid-binding protein